jgi:transcriptional regulator with XRE-family HTH domain
LKGQALTQSETAVRRILGARVAGLRRVKKWTQNQLAERAQLPRGYVADIEGGRRNPSLRTMLRLAGALGVPIAGLLAADKEPGA